MYVVWVDLHKWWFCFASAAVQRAPHPAPSPSTHTASSSARAVLAIWFYAYNPPHSIAPHPTPPPRPASVSIVLASRFMYFAPHLAPLPPQALQEVIGPRTDIPAPDINTDERHMAWIFDQYSKLRGFAPAAVTGG
jgi:hypothetical protein